MTALSCCILEKTSDTLGEKVSEALQLGNDGKARDWARQCDSVLKHCVVMPPGPTVLSSHPPAFREILLCQSLGFFESKEGVAKERKFTESMLGTK